MTSTLVLPDVSLTTPISFSAGTTAVAADVNTDFSAVETAISAVNTNFQSIETWADAIPDGDLASPNNSTYKTLLTANAGVGLDHASGTHLLWNTGLGTLSAGSLTAVTENLPLPVIYFDDADYTVGGLTQKLRLRAQVITNATAWSSVTATFGLYPITSLGGSDALSVVFGSVVSGSTAACVNPAASDAGVTPTSNNVTSGDFTIPSDGMFCLGVVLSAQLTNNARAFLVATLQTRHV